MILKVFTRGDYLAEREVIEMGKKLEEDKYCVEYYDLDDADTNQLCEIYDIYSSPAIVITQEDGRIVEKWQTQMPRVGEIKNLMGH